MEFGQEVKSRLSEYKEPTLAPFVRATTVIDCSIYWLPVSQFPMLPRQREWILEFHKRLGTHLAQTRKLRQEMFLQFKSLYPDLLNSFTATSGDHMPMTGASLTPGEVPPELPDFESVKKQVEAAGKNGKPLDVNQWMPDVLHWFLLKKPERQRELFFGRGGMFTLYLAPDPETVAPVIEVPRYMRTHPAYSDSMQGEINAAYSLRDKFLKQSKEAFGEPFRGDASYKGLMFVLPLFTSASLVQATPEQREAWFAIFDGYLIESKVDTGLVLALKEPQFDEELMILLERMEADGHVYRS